MYELVPVPKKKIPSRKLWEHAEKRRSFHDVFHVDASRSPTINKIGDSLTRHDRHFISALTGISCVIFHAVIHLIV